MDDFKRFEMKFFADDPLDCELWAVLEPFINRRHGTQTIKAALARLLLNSAPQTAQPIQPIQLPPRMSIEELTPVMPSAADGTSDDEAANNFLSTFA
jgi:hypothetical protein